MLISNYNWLDNLQSKARVYFKKHSLPRWLVFSFDAGVFVFSFIFAYLLRFNFEQAPIDFGKVLFQSRLYFLYTALLNIYSDLLPVFYVIQPSGIYSM